MAQHKFLQEVGTPALCGEVKTTRERTDTAGEALIELSENLQTLASEAETAINDADGRIDTLTNEIIAGEVTTPMATENGETITTQDGIEILAYRIL